MINVILCGGSGTRLWPISRKLMPKQFVRLFDNRSLYQQTLTRNSGVCGGALVVSNEEQYFLAADQKDELDKLPGVRFLLEPFGKNTAGAIALACFSLHEEDTVLVTPSDHLIKKTKEYEAAVKKAVELAAAGFLVTFGIKPLTPETGYGYIEASGENVASFTEKPDVETAKKYLANGNYLWNSGMFCFQASVYLNELKKYRPDIYEACRLAFENKVEADALFRIKPEYMEKIPDESIDYAVMEQSSNVKVVAADIGWSDVGSFDSLYYEMPKDEHGNTVSHNMLQVDSSNNLVYSDERLVALIGIEDLHIIDTADALLVAKRGSGQKIKQVVDKLKKAGSDLPNLHLTVHRPWGTYTVLEEGPGYKIKKIIVKPKERLSLQKHFHRNEHWVVVSGTAQVRLAENDTIVRQNESIYIPMGEKHRLGNPGKVDLVVIEAQVGEYLGEDDIVRFDDDYKRE